MHYYYIPITRVEGWDDHVIWLKLPHGEVEKKFTTTSTALRIQADSMSRDTLMTMPRLLLLRASIRNNKNLQVSFMRYTIWNGGRTQQPCCVKPLDKHFLPYNEDRAVSMLKDFVCNTSYEQLFEFRLTSCSHYNKIHFVLSCVVNYHFCF